MPRPTLQIEVFSDQRVGIFGKTGTGKTFLARRLLEPFPRVVVLDIKGTLKPWGLEEWGPDTRRRLDRGEDVRIRAALEPGADPERYWDSILEAAYNAANLVVYVDEAFGLSSSSKPSPMVTAVWTRGREYGVGAVAASQRPAWIPKIFISEAEHFFMFRLQMQQDRDAMSEMMGPQVREPIPPEHKHGFWYYSVEEDEPVFIARLPSRREEGEEGVFELEVEEESE